MYVLKFRVQLYPLKSCFLCQSPPAPCPSAVPGTVLRGHSLSTGHGVLPTGGTHINDQIMFIQSLPNTSLFHFFALCCLVYLEAVRATFPVSSQGDLKTYLHSGRVADSETPDPLILQQMACDIASGLLHLHKYNFIHRYSMSVSPALFTFFNINASEGKNPPECSELLLLVSSGNNILVLPE